MRVDGMKIGSSVLMKNTWMTGKNVKIKRHNDPCSVMSSVSRIWQITGNFPIFFHGSGQSRKCHFSKLLAAYHFVLFSTCIGFISSGICEWEQTLGLRSVVMSTTTIIRTISSLSCTLISCLVWLCFHKDFVDAVEFLASQSLILNQLGCRINSRKAIRIIRSCVWGALTMMVLLSLFDAFIFMHFSSMTVIGFLRWFFWNAPTVIQVMISTIFIALVIFLGLHFQELNNKLIAVKDKNNSSPPKVIEVTNECAESLRLIAKIHYNLCKIAKCINWIFSGVIIIMVVTAFVILSSSLYFIFNEIVKAGETNYMSIGTYISWQITHAVPIIIAVITCNWTTNEAALTGKLIHEIHIESTESKLYEIIRSLSLQLHHQKLEFSGAGLFPINSSLLQTMIGNMTTSLVILIQFQPTLND